MGENEKDFEVPERGTPEYYREEIVDIVNKVDDGQFLRRIYIILRNHKEKRGS